MPILQRGRANQCKLAYRSAGGKGGIEEADIERGNIPVVRRARPVVIFLYIDINTSYALHCGQRDRVAEIIGRRNYEIKWWRRGVVCELLIGTFWFQRDGEVPAI